MRQLDSQSQQGEGCDLSFRPVGQQSEHEGLCLSINETRLVFISNLYCTPGHALAAKITPRNGLDPVFTAFVEVTECQQSGNNYFRVTATIRAIKSD
jgi:hypothetical protein